MAETTASSDSGSTSEDVESPAVTARPARTGPGLLGVLVALVGLAVAAAGIVGVATVAWPLALLIPVGGITFASACPGQYLVQRSVVALDEQAKASMVANLLVVLTSEQQTTPTVNTGSLS